jgi:hypothetical protein
MNDVMKVVKDLDLKIRNQQFDNQCVIEIEFRQRISSQVIGRFEKIDEIEINYLYTC